MSGRRILWAALGLAASAAMASDAPIVLPFSNSINATALSASWKNYPMSREKVTASVQLARDGDRTVLHIEANKNAGGVAHGLRISADHRLGWRWKVDHSVVNADLKTRHGDDFSARVYVFFDVPLSELTFGERVKLKLARAVMGVDLPHAALCYVWDNTHPIGTIEPNVYYGAVKTIVLQSGDSHAGQWQTEHRDLGADFNAAFGRQAPQVTGVAVASDADNTGGHVNAWFADLRLSPSARAALPPVATHP